MKIFFNNIYSIKFSRNFVFDLIRVNMAIVVQMSDVALSLFVGFLFGGGSGGLIKEELYSK